MRVVLDTNVLMSGIFFGGIPGRLLIAWRAKMIQFVVSEEILDEYRQVAMRLGERYSEIDISNIVDLHQRTAETAFHRQPLIGVACNLDDLAFKLIQEFPSKP